MRVKREKLIALGQRFKDAYCPHNVRDEQELEDWCRQFIADLVKIGLPDYNVGFFRGYAEGSQYLFDQINN